MSRDMRLALWAFVLGVVTSVIANYIWERHLRETV